MTTSNLDPLRALYRSLPPVVRGRIYALRGYLNTCIKSGYIPNYSSPRTFNEKINYLKKHWNNPLMPVCADKIAAKDYVAQTAGAEYVNPNLYTGRTITPDTLATLIKKHDSVFLKANHNSGPVMNLDKNSSIQDLEAACKEIEKQLHIDYGKLVNESWYSKITPSVLVERRLFDRASTKQIEDYKFHVFNNSGQEQIIIVDIHYDRFSNYHHRSLFDVDLNYLNISIRYPSIITKIAGLENYDEMVEVARKLSKPFSYVRVDLYSVNSKTYFGELTFAQGGGYSSMRPPAADYWLGSLWRGRLTN